MAPIAKDKEASRRASVTGALLVMTSCVIAALLVVETILGLVWSMGGGVGVYASLFK
jgi:hypothetical protein